MSEFIVLCVLALSLVAYVVTGGADFGAGILELLVPAAQRPRMREVGQRAIAPIWEANHVWIVVALVILFVGFPRVHVAITTHLHIPLLLMLAGIMIRGTAFTFRYYDVGDDAHVRRLWSGLYRVGSVMVPLLFGHLAAALFRGRALAEPTSVFETYLAPWLGAFPLATGLFTVALFAWLAAVFLVGELHGEEEEAMVFRGRALMLVTVALGGVVSLLAWFEGVPALTRGVSNPWLYLFVLGATVMAVFLWKCLGTGRPWTERVLAGGIATAIVGGYWGVTFPVAVVFQDAPAITWHGSAAPAPTLNVLAIALLVAASIIVPGLVWLYRLFKSDGAMAASERG